MKKLVVLLAVIFVFTSAIGAMAAQSALEKDVIRVGTESTFRPFEFRNVDNEVVGFDIDLINMIAEKLGKKVEIVDSSFESLIPSLLTKKIDIIAAGMSATEERAKRVAFSDTYYLTPSAVVVKAEESGITKEEDLKGDKVATVQMGTIQDAYVSKLGLKEVKRFSKTDDAFREVLLGRADFAVVDGTVTQENLENNKDFTDTLKKAFNLYIDKGMALAMSKDDPQFVEAVDNALRELKESGALDELEKKWMGEK